MGLSRDSKKRLDYALAGESASDELESLLAGLTFGTNYFVDGANGDDGADGDSLQSPFATIQEAVDSASAGDVIYIAPGDYDEAVVIVTDNLTLVGLGGKGAVSIVPSASNATAIKIDGTTASGRVEEVTLVNIGGECNGTGSGLHVKGNIRRFRAYGSKFEGGANALKLESTAEGSVGDSQFIDCEFAWATTAVLIAVSGAGDPVTQTLFKNCLFHNYAARGIYVTDTFTADLWVKDSFFGFEENGTAPSNEFVKADIASSSGMFAGNFFATATNASSVLAIASGIMWVANATEAGFSTARPA